MQCRHLNTSMSMRSSSSCKLLRCMSTRSRPRLNPAGNFGVDRGQKVNKDCTAWTLVHHSRKNEEKKSFSQATSPKEKVFVGDGRQRPPSKVSFSQVSSGTEVALFQVPAGKACSGAHGSGISRSYADDPELQKRIRMLEACLRVHSSSGLGLEGSLHFRHEGHGAASCAAGAFLWLQS